jgi:hypothetical protein
VYQALFPPPESEPGFEAIVPHEVPVMRNYSDVGPR